ncbi:MAG: hypothetical protein ACKOJF_17585, partial [Planctomycetaceae bacterium]
MRQDEDVPGIFRQVGFGCPVRRNPMQVLGAQEGFAKKIPEFMAEVAGGSRYSLTGEMAAIWAAESTGPSGQC